MKYNKRILIRNIALGALMLMCFSSCKKDAKEGQVVSAILVSGTEDETSSSSGVGIGIGENGPVPVVTTSTTTRKIPCEYGVLNIDFDGDKIPDASLPVKLTSKSAVHFFRAEEMLKRNQVPYCYYENIGSNSIRIDSVVHKR